MIHTMFIVYGALFFSNTGMNQNFQNFQKTKNRRLALFVRPLWPYECMDFQMIFSIM
jgi:hypothetical protein